MRKPLFLLVVASLSLTACNQLPRTGPSRSEIGEPGGNRLTGIQIVDVDDAIARRLQDQHKLPLFSDRFGIEKQGMTRLVVPGDVLDISIWEAPPAALFASIVTETRTAAAASPAKATTLPDQVVDREGYIDVPFAGRVPVGGKTVQAVQAEIVKRLTGKANQPEAIVRLTQSASSESVTVVGDVATSVKMTLTPGGERLLDALAAAGGVRQPVSKMTLQLTRGQQFHALPLETIIRDPLQNIPLASGDVITALFQPYSFTALGAAGKNEEINFEAQGISLAQALARSGGLLDSRSNPNGVFVFRFEPQKALEWPSQPVATTPEGMVPVIYRLDMTNPASFFAMQGFVINDKDILYVANSPAAELQKFLNIIFSLSYPALTLIQVTK
ncbi:MAG: polysaccharide biosynthesis/export family protein [Pseudomonadota bacterium]